MTFTAKTADPAIHTVESITSTVSVAEFRNLTDHLFRVCRVDFNACKGESERAKWVEQCRKVAGWVREAGCKRAKREDWDRRESALELSATLIIRVLEEDPTPAPTRPRLRLIQGGRS